MEALLFALSLLFNLLMIIGFYIVVRRLFKKYDELDAFYSKFFGEMQTRLIAVLNTMKQIDIRGSFEADDEVGSVYQQIRGMITALDVFLAEEEDEEKEEYNKIYKGK